MFAGAEPSSAAEGVDTVVGEATEVSKTGSGIKTQNKSKDPKVHTSLQSSPSRQNDMTYIDELSLSWLSSEYITSSLLPDCLALMLKVCAARCQMHHLPRTTVGTAQAKTRSTDSHALRHEL